MRKVRTSSSPRGPAALAEFYEPGVLDRGHALYDTIRAWATRRDDVVVIGGWAVLELVVPLRAMQSRDVDILLQTEEALRDFSRSLDGWGLRWRTHGRTRFKDCHFKDDPERAIMVDVFTHERFGDHLFGRQAITNIKRADAQGFVPALAWLIRDKVDTVPLRRERDAVDKRAKDLLDVGALVFWNKEGALPGALRAGVPERERHRAGAFVAEAAARYPRFEEELDAVRRWLEVK